MVVHRRDLTVVLVNDPRTIFTSEGPGRDLNNSALDVQLFSGWVLEVYV